MLCNRHFTSFHFEKGNAAMRFFKNASKKKNEIT